MQLNPTELMRSYLNRFGIRSRTHTAEQCRDYLLQFIDNDDRLGVFDCSNNDFATMRALNKISDLWSN